jgi:hypothetical protein
VASLKPAEAASTNKRALIDDELPSESGLRIDDVDVERLSPLSQP